MSDIVASANTLDGATKPVLCGEMYGYFLVGKYGSAFKVGIRSTRSERDRLANMEHRRGEVVRVFTVPEETTEERDGRRLPIGRITNREVVALLREVRDARCTTPELHDRISEMLGRYEGTSPTHTR